MINRKSFYFFIILSIFSFIHHTNGIHYDFESVIRDNIDEIVETLPLIADDDVLIENRRIPISDRYNAIKCITQVTTLFRGLNKNALWVMKGNKRKLNAYF